ncbi:MAG: type II toxin-antitoxin system PemK/MazF family toxin [Fimbriimonas sp.]
MNQRGTVVRVRLDPVEGREQAGTRPAIVISATILNEKADVLIVAPITSKKVDRVFPFEALLDHNALGLELPSKVLLNQIRTVSKTRISGTYGVADRETLATVNAAMKITLGL